MSWKERVYESALTMPSGARFTFDYEVLSEEFDKKGSAFNFTGANGTYIQRLGTTSSRYPLRMYIHGTDYDEVAEQFMNGLRETGVFRLEHPIYGQKNVYPLGTVKRRDDLVNAAGQTPIDLIFWETIEDIFPSIREDKRAAVSLNINKFNDILSELLGKSLDELKKSSAEGASAQNIYSKLFSKTTKTLKKLLKSTSSAQNQFNSVERSILKNIDNLIKDPSKLALQTMNLIQSPGRGLSSITGKIQSYRNILNGVFSFGVADFKIGSSNEIRHSFHLNDMYATGAVSGAVVAAVSGVSASDSIETGDGVINFQTQTQAIEAAEELLLMLDEVTNWREANFDSLGIIDTGEVYQILHKIVTLGAGALIESSFNLKQERSIVLDRDRNIIELEYQLYGTTDVNLNLLIASNEFNGSDILELKRGREILYYV